MDQELAEVASEPNVQVEQGAGPALLKPRQEPEPAEPAPTSPPPTQTPLEPPATQPGNAVEPTQNQAAAPTPLVQADQTVQQLAAAAGSAATLAAPPAANSDSITNSLPFDASTLFGTPSNRPQPATEEQPPAELSPEELEEYTRIRVYQATPEQPLERYERVLRLGLVVQGGRVCFASTYDLIEWDATFAQQHSVAVPDGIYELIVACPDTRPWLSKQRHTDIDVFLIPTQTLPELTFDDIPFLAG